MLLSLLLRAFFLTEPFPSNRISPPPKQNPTPARCIPPSVLINDEHTTNKTCKVSIRLSPSLPYGLCFKANKIIKFSSYSLPSSRISEREMERQRYLINEANKRKLKQLKPTKTSLACCLVGAGSLCLLPLLV